MKVVVFSVLVVILCLSVLSIVLVLLFNKSPLVKKQQINVTVPKPVFQLPFHLRNEIALVKSIENSDTTVYCDMYNIDIFQLEGDKWAFMFHLLDTNRYKYIILTDLTLSPNSNKPIRRLIQQSGDNDLIVCRDKYEPNKISLDMLIFKNSEWSKFKCLQLFFNPDNIQTLLLDQVYTNFKHKSLIDAKNQLNKGLPYMLQCTCVYNEKAFELDNSKKEMYPWTGVDGFIEIEKIPVFNKMTKDQLIPKRIYQTNDSTLVPLHRNKFSIEAWKQLNPEYEYHYLDALDRRKLIETHFDATVSKAYDMLLPGAYQADLFRYCLLYVYGGCYVDSQTQPFLPLREVITPNLEFLSGEEILEFNFGIWNGFICCTPKHPALKLTIDNTVKNVLERNYTDSCIGITGPCVLGRSVNKWLNRDVNTSLRQAILPSTMKLLPNSLNHIIYNKQSVRVFKFYANGKPFLLQKYLQNPQQLKSMQINMWDNDEINGKQRYDRAYQIKEVFKFPLYPKVVYPRI